jgi:glucose/arabinose dehydrogenase
MILSLFFQAAAIAASEAEYYKVDYLVAPQGERIEVGGLDFLPDGRLVCSTRRGQVWIIENPLAANAADAKFTLFAEGLHEGLGLEVVNGEIYVLQRGELSKLVDEDKDGTCDRIEAFSQGWGYSGHYHEFAFGLPRDAQGNFYASLNVSFSDSQWWHGRSVAPYRGWILRIKPDGSWEPVASGARSPAGLGATSKGEIFYTDNQGDWMPACPIFHVKDGAFYGHPASLNWTKEYRAAGRTASDTIAPKVERARAALWLPYDWSRSTGNLVEDTTGGKFGPFGGQLFVAEMTNGYVLRAGLEEVQGQYQGWVVPFRHKVGSNVRLRFAPDGTLFCGFTDRGWGGQPPGDGIARLRWSGKQPFEIREVHLGDSGFEVTFTEPLSEVAAAALARAEVRQYDYNYWWEYGSPVQHLTPRAVIATSLDATRTKATLRVPLEAGMVARVKLPGLQSMSGAPLLHDEFAYTINELPGRAPTGAHVAKLVEQPEARESGNEGVLYLTEGDVLAAWNATGWQMGEIKLSDDRRGLVAQPDAKHDDWNGPTLSNIAAANPSELVSKFEFGDIDFSLQFQLPEGGNSGVYLMGRYEVQLLDSSSKTELKFGDCGGIYAAEDRAAWPGRAPTFNTFRGAGRWHWMSGTFEAPRFDAQGRKVANAKFKRVMIDDTLLHEELEVPTPTQGGWEGEVARARLRIQGDHGPVAVRAVRVKARDGVDERSDWVSIFDGRSLDGWKITDGGSWAVENGEIVGRGSASHLFSPRGDYKDFELRAKLRINTGGNSGLYFRVAYGPGWPSGYEAQINSTHTDPVKTGSLYHYAPFRAQLVGHDTWFDYHVLCKDEPEGTRIQIRVNHILVTDYLDRERKHAAGHIALQQHHDGSVLRAKNLEIRELR